MKVHKLALKWLQLKDDFQPDIKHNIKPAELC